MSNTGKSRFPQAVALALIMLTALTTIAAYVTRQAQQAADIRQQFSELADEYKTLIVERFRMYEYGLRGTRGAMSTMLPQLLTRRQFEIYVATRELPQEFPGARGIGYIHRVAPATTEAFLEARRDDGMPSFAIRELDANPGERFIITYIYPSAENAGATGLDIASEQSRRNAALVAARSGWPQLTAPITLVQASGQSNAGFVLLLPVYRDGITPDSPEQREQAAVGWTYSPLVVSEALADLGPRQDQIAFALRDEAAQTEFHRSRQYDNATLRDAPRTATNLQLFGRHWTVQFRATPAFMALHAGLHPGLLATLVAGIGLLLTAVAYGVLTNRERQRTAQQQEENFAYRIVEMAPQGLLVVDEDGKIIRANQSAEHIFGWPLADLIGRPVEDLVPDEIRGVHHRLRASYDNQVRGMGARRQLRARRADGTLLPVLIRLAPLQIGSRRMVIAGISDISSEVAAVEALERGQRYWEQIANSLPQLIWTCDPEGNCDFLSQQWASYTGVPVEQQLDAGWLQQIHWDDRDRLIAAWRQSVATETPLAIEFRIRRHDDEYRWFYTRAEPLRDANGKILRWIGSNTDIEDRYQAEQYVRALLEDMEERVAERTADLDRANRDLTNILNSIPSMIAYWDRDQINRFANHARDNWFGVIPDQMVGRHLRDLLGEKAYADSLPYIEKALHGERQVFEREMLDSDGVSHIGQVNYVPDIKDGEVLGFYALVFDVSELRATERAQAAAREAAEQATRAKSVFLTSMSHELRTPMNSILGFSDLLLGQFFGKLNEKQYEYAGLIRQSGEHLLKLMDEVLELSKIEAGRVSVSIEPVGISGIIKSVAANLQPLADKYQVIIDARNPVSEEMTISADLTRMAQVLINLGSNAIKYNRPGGWVKFRCEERPDGMLRIMVSDNGRGIANEHQASAFQAFNRLGAEHGSIEGTGIGLALVKNLVGMMGGEIGFTSTLDEGSTFWVDMPIAATHISATVPTAGQDSAQATLPSLDRAQILYIEDNENNRTLFRHYMSVLKGVTIIEAEDGPRGIAMARSRMPDLIFLDINLPGMNGYDVLEELKADPSLRSIPVIALTANAMEGDAERGLQKGFVRYLSKPARLDEVMRAVYDLL